MSEGELKQLLVGLHPNHWKSDLKFHTY